MNGTAVDPRWVARQFAGGGALAEMMLAKDWSTSPLGPIDAWSRALLGAVSLMLPAGAEIVLFWGPDFITLYNDAYATTIGDRHPTALGRPGRESWHALWDTLEPMLAHVRATGETYHAKDHPFSIERDGVCEEVYFDISYSPVREDDGSVGGVLCIVSETTERVRAARAVAEDKARLAQMFEEAPGFIAVLRGPEHTFDLINHAGRELIGDRDGEVLGRSVREMLPELVEQGYLALLDQVRTTGRPYRGSGAAVALYRRHDVEPEVRYVDFVLQPLVDASGAVNGVFVQGSDVTDRHLAENALALSRESLELATQAAGVGTWDADLTGAVSRVSWSDRARAIFGVPAGQPMEIDDFYASLHPEDVARVRSGLNAAVDPASRELLDLEFRMFRADSGEMRWLAATGRGIFADDLCIRAVGTVIDITHRRQDREALRESEARFRNLSDSLPALIWQTDELGNIVFANLFFETLLGVSPAEIIRDGWTRLYLPEDRPAVAAVRARIFAERQPVGGDLRLMKANGDS